jgi:ABC-type dipeptide/oligopeptide/nickel transport system permease component
MIGYIVRRLLALIPILLFASIVVFLMIHLIPGDAASAIAGPDVTPEQLEALREKMGLNEPLYYQYWIWLRQILGGDLGVSNVSHLPVATLIASRLPATLELTTAAIVFAVIIAIPAGVLAALRHRKPADHAVSVVSSIGLSVPEYWSGLLAIIFFSVWLGWLPPGGRVAPADNVWLWLRSLLLPAVTLGLPLAAMQVRFVRASMIEVLHEQYILTARSKGLNKLRIVVVHALRNSLIPLMTVLGIQVGRLMGGAILVESIYNWPGIGRMIVQSISQRDYALVQAEVLLIVIIFTVLNLVIDILYGVVDPRVRLGAQSAR